VILEGVFGVCEPERKARLTELLTAVVDGISPAIALVPALRREFGGFGPFAAFRRKQVALHAELDALIAIARTEPPRDDILSLLVHARGEDGEPLSDEELRDQLLLLVVAGHETTGIAIAWAIHALHLPENAPALERLRAEVALAPDAPPSTLDELPWLRAVCDETLRRYPGAPAPAPRRLLAPLEMLGQTLPEGAAVAAAIGLVHFREELYPEPLAFRPERFLGDRRFTPFEFVPFGGGARRCLGAALASYEMRLVVASLIRLFRMAPARPGPDPGKVRAANVGPRYGVQMVLSS
jgi:cytochrome P450